MPPSPTEVDPARRLRLVVDQLDRLPTLSPVAVRLLELTASESSSGREVIRLIASDPALSTRVLSLIRRAARGVKADHITVDRAVALLGFNEIRSAALAVEVFETLDHMTASPGGMEATGAGRFDRVMFWRHSIGVAAAAEALTRAAAPKPAFAPGEAFLAGLIHDLGRLALHVVLPRTLDRACALAETRGIDLDRACAMLLSSDTHAIGRLLAQRWGLPESLCDVIFLCGRPVESIPSDARFDLPRLVSFADRVARHEWIAPAGHGAGPEATAPDPRLVRVRAEALKSIVSRLPAEIAERSSVLGLGEETEAGVLRAALDRASRAASGPARRALTPPERAGDPLDGTTRELRLFFDDAESARSVPAVLGAIGRSAARIAPGLIRAAMVAAPGATGRLERYEFNRDGSIGGLRAASGAEARAAASENHPGFLRLTGADGAAVTFELAPPSSTATEQSASVRAARAMGPVWCAALAMSAATERADDLAERLADHARRLADAQQSLADRRATEALGEMAAGAAHEMNNPLTVISGRAQLLASRLSDAGQREWADEIVRQSRRLSDLITGLRLTAETASPRPQLVTGKEVVERAADLIHRAAANRLNVRIATAENVGPISIDVDQVATAMREVLQNAHEAGRGGEIRIAISGDRTDGRLIVRVEDAGPGFSDRALVHAFDPFFSEKAAGRGVGLGLSRAKRLIELNGGTIGIENNAHGGAGVTIRLPMLTAAAGGFDFAAAVPKTGPGVKPSARAA